MRGAPVPASPQLVAAALAPAGAATRLALLRSLASQDKTAAEQAARSLKKIVEAAPTLLYPHRKALLQAAFAAQDIRVQWNLTIILGLLPLKGADKSIAVDLMFERLQHPSGLNRTMAMQALIHLSAGDPALRNRVTPILHQALESGTPAMQARARRILKITR